MQLSKPNGNIYFKYFFIIYKRVISVVKSIVAYVYGTVTTTSNHEVFPGIYNFSKISKQYASAIGTIG